MYCFDWAQICAEYLSFQLSNICSEDSIVGGETARWCSSSLSRQCNIALTLDVYIRVKLFEIVCIRIFRTLIKLTKASWHLVLTENFILGKVVSEPPVRRRLVEASWIHRVVPRQLLHFGLSDGISHQPQTNLSRFCHNSSELDLSLI